MAVHIRLARAGAKGWRMKTGVECEYHAYDGEGHGWGRPDVVVDELTRVSRSVPVATSDIREVIGFFFSNSTPARDSAQHISWISRIHTPTPGRPNSMVKPASPATSTSARRSGFGTNRPSAPE